MMMLNYRGGKTGFTIVELLIVIVVIAILAAIALVSYNGITNRAKTSASIGYLHAFSQKYQEQATIGGSSDGSITSAQFYTLQSTISGPRNVSTALTAINDGTTMYMYCMWTYGTGVTSYFINSTDRITPTKGVCTGPDVGEYTLQ